MVLEVSTTKQDGSIIAKQEKEYRNIGLSRKGEPATAAWLISSYSEEKSTAFRPYETKKETFTFSLTGDPDQDIMVHAKLYSHHGLPTEFGKPAGGELVLQATKGVGKEAEKKEKRKKIEGILEKLLDSLE